MSRIKYTLFILLFFTLLVGCKGGEGETTSLEIVDNDRHYYPVIQGEEKIMVFPLVNKGDNPFVLKDIIVSCGCIVAHTASLKHIPAGGEGKLVLKFDTTKNIGYVKHYVTLYGNFDTVENIEVTFDLNVVPDAHYTKDYEELYSLHKGSTTEDLVDGTIDRDYYLDVKQ
ncbi:DUF1573 domain-containing protein [Myroides odoratimimus]|uniref:DUF1573 domain-containing protein n=1 Tax=Myroides odoratimimus TaxID=76832 RepID=UPI002DBDC409|nr:DUF1573 domain-containing protein [Myroides odoratimimus]MEC4051958.1 DUF1573 domain-containing protein [Myroides odoratimimus]